MMNILGKKEVVTFISLTAAIFGFLAFVYDGGLLELVRRWSDEPEYGHGFLIPAVSLYLIWENRGKFFNAPQLKTSYKGYLICFVSLIALFVGEISALYILIQLSFILFLYGLLYTLLDNRIKYANSAIFLLLFSIPLPYFFEVILTAKMQLISSSFGVKILELFGIPVFLSGNVIDLGDFKLQVVEACSGMRYLFPLMSIGFIVVLFYKVSVWKRIFVFLSTIPITIFMNSFRIAVTGILVEQFGSEVAEGFLHDFEGWVIFTFCLGLLVLEIYLIELLTSRKSIMDFLAASEHKVNAGVFKSNEFNNYLKKVNTHLGISCVLIILVAAGISNIKSREEVKYLDIGLQHFPLNVGPWIGRSEYLEKNVIESLKLDDYLTINYRHVDDANKLINFYVAYYASQKKGQSPHSPSVCIPGGGWEFNSLSREVVAGIPVNRAVIESIHDKQLVYYWFVERGVPMANEYVKKLKLFADSVTENRTDGSLVRVVTPILKDETVIDAEKRLAGFIEEANPKLMNILPSAIIEE